MRPVSAPRRSHKSSTDFFGMNEIDENTYLSNRKLGYILIDIEILSKRNVFKEFFHKFFTLHWFKKLKSVDSSSVNPSFTPSEVYSMLLSIGIHPSDKEYNDWLLTLSKDTEIKVDDDDNSHSSVSTTPVPNEILISDVIHLVTNHNFETSVSLTHYISAYLNFKNNKKFPSNSMTKHTSTSPIFKSSPFSQTFINRNFKLNKNVSLAVDPLKSVNNMKDAGWWIRFDRPPLYSPDKDDMYVIQRSTGYRVREHIPGYIKIALKCMYDGWLTRVQDKKIKHTLSEFNNSKCHRFDHPSSQLLIEPFVKLHNIYMKDFEPAHISMYDTFNDFFSRSLSKNARPISLLDGGITSNNACVSSAFVTDDIILCPCDGRFICFEIFQECRKLWIKGSKFHIQNLVGSHLNPEFYNKLLTNLDKSKCLTSAKISREFSAVYMQNMSKVNRNRQRLKLNDFFSVCIIRLPPALYHGYHYPFNGTVVDIYHITDGALFSVSPIVVNRDVNVLTENKRCCVLFDTEFGICCMIIIASFLVGSYSLKCEIGDVVERGDLMGKFRYGGSCIVLIFERERMQFCNDLIANSMNRTRVETIVQCRTRIGNRRVQQKF